MNPSGGLRDAFSPEARRRAAEFVAARGADAKPPPLTRGNGRGRRRQLEIDLTKLERFAEGRARVAERIEAAGGVMPRRRTDRREILTVDDLSIRFGGVQALNGMTLTARTGEVAGVIGPNGAGKTTFFNCLSGLLTPDSRASRLRRQAAEGRACRPGPAWPGPDLPDPAAVPEPVGAART